MNSINMNLSISHNIQEYNLKKTLSLSPAYNFSQSPPNIALNTTCKLFDANATMAMIRLDNQVDYDALTIMSAKGVEDACAWTGEELEIAGSSFDLACDTATLTNICSQWNDYASIQRIEATVHRLKNTLEEDSDREIDEHDWISSKQFTGPFDFIRDTYPNCTTGSDNRITC